VTMQKIEKLNEDNQVIAVYNSLADAAASIESKMENWKVQLYIAYALINNGRAYKFKWRAVK
jgi:hypothetical protein